MHKLKFNWPLLALLLLLPRLALANMNGGLHISNWVIFLFLFLLVLFSVSIFLSLWNVQRKSRGIRVFNIIVWMPMMAAGVIGYKLAWPVLIPLVQVLLIIGSVSKKTIPDENTDKI